MSDHHDHDHECGCAGLGRRAFLTMAGAAAGMVLLPLRQASAQATEIVIGSTISQSGPFLGIVQPFGKLSEAWVQQVNARGGIRLSSLGRSLPLRLVQYDDQSEPPTALRFYERMATVDKVNLFLGPFSSFVTNAALQASVTNMLPFFMVCANDSIMFEKRNEWATTGLAPASWEYRRLADLYAKKGGVKTFALASRDNLHENQAMEGFGDALRKAGFQVVYQEILPRDTKDFASAVLAIKQRNPDVVFIESLPPPFTLGFLKQARELGLNPKDVICGHAPVPVIRGMGNAAENILSCIYSFDGDTPDHKEYVGLCQQAGFEPWQYSESGIRYVAYKRIEDALRRAGSLDPAAIQKAMWETNLSLYGGELVVKHDNVGYGSLHPWPTQVKGGKHVSLWPLDQGVRRHEFKGGRW
jgi:ABC-type branched-subunit amino acid transport system substrate-binding protein